MNRVLLAGATGYLGGYIAKEQRKRSYSVRTIVLNPEKLKQNNEPRSSTEREDHAPAETER